MTGIDFDLWIEDFRGSLNRHRRFDNYEEAQHEGMVAINTYRNVRSWHVTVAGQRPEPSKDPVPYSLERWHEFHENPKVPV
jgi:hypothetical protein